MRLTNNKEQFETLNINRWSLIFNNSKIENQFRREYFRKSVIPLRYALILVTALYALFGLLDLYTAYEFIDEFFIIRFLVIVPLILFVWLLSFTPIFKKIWQELISICYFLAGIGISYMLLRNPTNVYYYGGLFLIFIGGYFFIKLHFKNATITGFLLILVYNLFPLFGDQFNHLNIDFFIITNAFFISANVIAASALYNNNFLVRREFHQRLLLSQQKEEIKSINENLEKRVLERTELLESRNEELKNEITTRLDIEKKLIQSKQKAEESDRLKSAFLTNMSHEIRTPMNGIIGFLDMITDPDISKEEQIHFLDIVKQSGNRLLQTINDIVEVSKIESGELNMNYSEVDLAKTFKYISDLFSFAEENKNIQFKTQSFPGKFIIRTDGNKLESILINLVKNAFKFTDSGLIEVGVTRLHNKLQFYVKDTGKGIPKERHEAIFDRFVQADLGLSRGYEGAGLGLSISKAYVAYLDGKIWLESEPEKGSTFFFTIKFDPVKTYKSEADNIQPEDSTVLVNKQITVLVAEDDDVSYNLISTILKNENLEIIRAANGKNAVDIYQQNQDKISFILMDIKMPILDGIEATKEIRAFDKEVPIIAQTAFALSGDKDLAIQAGCNHYLSKPIKRQDLLTSIKRIL